MRTNLARLTRRSPRGASIHRRTKGSNIVAGAIGDDCTGMRLFPVVRLCIGAPRGLAHPIREICLQVCAYDSTLHLPGNVHSHTSLLSSEMGIVQLAAARFSLYRAPLVVFLRVLLLPASKSCVFFCYRRFALPFGSKVIMHGFAMQFFVAARSVLQRVFGHRHGFSVFLSAIWGVACQVGKACRGRATSRVPTFGFPSGAQEQSGTFSRQTAEFVVLGCYIARNLLDFVCIFVLSAESHS